MNHNVRCHKFPLRHFELRSGMHILDMLMWNLQVCQSSRAQKYILVRVSFTHIFNNQLLRYSCWYNEWYPISSFSPFCSVQLKYCYPCRQSCSPYNGTNSRHYHICTNKVYTTVIPRMIQKLYNNIF